MALTNDEKATMKAAIEIIERETDNDGDKLVLRGFGAFRRVAVAAKTARNPVTGDPVDVPARSVIRFSGSKSCART